MKENFGIEDAQEMGAVGNEALDRRNRKPLGETPIDEDEELVVANDPKKRYITAADLVDDAYLNYGEGDEANNKGGEAADSDNELIDDSALIDLDAIEKGLDMPVDYKIEELNPENDGPIGAVSVSAGDEKIYVRREEGEAKEMGNIDLDTDLDRRALVEEYAHLEGVAVADKRPEKTVFKNSDKHSRLTVPAPKVQRGLRGLIRGIIKPGSN